MCGYRIHEYIHTTNAYQSFQSLSNQYIISQNVKLSHFLYLLGVKNKLYLLYNWISFEIKKCFESIYSQPLIGSGLVLRHRVIKWFVYFKLTETPFLFITRSTVVPITNVCAWHPKNLWQLSAANISILNLHSLEFVKTDCLYHIIDLLIELICYFKQWNKNASFRIKAIIDRDT